LSTCEIESGRRCHAVEVVAAGIEGVCSVLRRGSHLLAVKVLTRGEPQFRRRPIEVVLEPVVRVRAAAEPGVIVRRDQARMPLGRLVRAARRL
jgi:hypothetical protein